MVETDKAYIAHCGLGFTYIVPHCVTLFFLQIRINVRDLFITIRFLGITSIEKRARVTVSVKRGVGTTPFP